MRLPVTDRPPSRQSAQILIDPTVKLGYDPARRRRRAACEGAATSGVPQRSQRTAGPVATTWRLFDRTAPSTAFSRVITASGHEDTHASQPVQRLESTLSRCSPEPFRSDAKASVGQTPTQTSQSEQPAGSTRTTASEQPGPSTRHGVRPGPSAPRVDSACMVASGSRSSIRSPQGTETAGIDSWPADASPNTGPPSENPRLPLRSRTKRSRSPTRVSQSSSSQPRTLTFTPTLTSCRSHPAVTISIDGTLSASQASPTRGNGFACRQAIETPRADPLRRTAATRTAAAALSPSISAPGSAKAALRQAATHTPQPMHLSPSTTTRPASRRSAPCGQARTQAVQAAPVVQHSGRHTATKWRAVLTPCKRDRRDTPPTDRLVRSLTGAATSAAVTRATAALRRATDCSRATFSLQPSAVRKSTISVPAGATPARRKRACSSRCRRGSARQPTTTRLGSMAASTSTRAAGASQISASSSGVTPDSPRRNWAASSPRRRGTGGAPTSSQMTTTGASRDRISPFRQERSNP